jgi:flagellar biosynthesis GTPase FlhF
MHYKRFCRPTLKEALQAVREDLGPTALVLSTRSVPAAGMRRWIGTRVVEVTAVMDGDFVSVSRAALSGNRLPDRTSGIAARLQSCGLSEMLATSIAQHPALETRGADADVMREAVADTLGPLTAIDDEPAPVEVFIGPPGAGKTTTIAKIAAQARGAGRSARHGVVAADGFRVGAVEQLRLYAGIIGAPFAVARSGEELTRALGDLRRRPILVDTAGRSPRDDGAADILDALSQRSGVRRHLVLPATTPAPQARRILQRFAVSRPDRLVITRLDEVDTLAPLVDVLATSGLPVSYLAHGQNVPDDLQRATPRRLTDWVLGDSECGACA